MRSFEVDSSMFDNSAFHVLYAAWVKALCTDGSVTLDEAVQETRDARAVVRSMGISVDEVDALEQTACRYARIMPVLQEEARV